MPGIWRRIAHVKKLSHDVMLDIVGMMLSVRRAKAVHSVMLDILGARSQAAYDLKIC